MPNPGKALQPRAASISGTVLMKRKEAKDCVAAIKANVIDMRRRLLDLQEREGWRALGYESWRACVVQEFEGSVATLYRELQAAQVDRDLAPLGLDRLVPTSHAVALDRLPDPEQRRAAYREAQEIAGGPPRAIDVQVAVEQRLPVKRTTAPAALPTLRPNPFPLQGTLAAARFSTDVLEAMAGLTPPPTNGQAAAQVDALPVSDGPVGNPTPGPVDAPSARSGGIIASAVSRPSPTDVAAAFRELRATPPDLPPVPSLTITAALDHLLSYDDATLRVKLAPLDSAARTAQRTKVLRVIQRLELLAGMLKAAPSQRAHPGVGAEA